MIIMVMSSTFIKTDECNHHDYRHYEDIDSMNDETMNKIIFVIT